MRKSDCRTFILCASTLMMFTATSGTAATPLEAKTSSSSTFPQVFSCSARFRVYDPVELTQLLFRIPLFSDCVINVPGATIRFTDSPPRGWLVENLPSGFHGPADMATCVSEVPHFECQPTLDSVQDIQMIEAEGPSGPIAHLPTICPVFIDCDRWPCGTPGPYTAQMCGDTDENSTLTAIDALIVLRGAVAIGDCPLIICDVDWNSSVSATDALTVLKAAVGLEVTLACPAPCTNLSFP